MHVSSHGLRQDGLSVSGVLVFFVTVAFFSPAAVSHAQDSALLFDGIDDTATIPSTNNWPSSTLALTLEAWIRPTDLSRNDLIAIIWGDSGYAFQQSRTDTSKLVWTISRGPTHSAATPTGSLVEGRWDHFAGTYDGTTMRIYQNGNLVAEEDHTYPGSVLMRGDVVLASRPSATTYAGVIDEVRLWLAVRTQEQISESLLEAWRGRRPGDLRFEFDRQRRRLGLHHCGGTRGSTVDRSGSRLTFLLRRVRRRRHVSLVGSRPLRRPAAG